MYSTGEYFPDRTLVHKNTIYVPNPAGTILHESRARTPSTAVVYDPAIPTAGTATATATRTTHTSTTTDPDSHDHVDQHARAGRKKRLSPEELRAIHDLGYARGVDVYQESPIDEFALTRPKGMHGRMRKMSGKTKKVLGSVTGNPLRQAVGEEQAAMGEAEVEAAREYKRHQRELMRAHAAGVSPGVAYGGEYERYGSAGTGRMIEPGYAGAGYSGRTADFATDRTIAYSEFPRRGIEHHTGTSGRYAPVQAGYTSTGMPGVRAAPMTQGEVVYHEEYLEERRVNAGDVGVSRRGRHRRHDVKRRNSHRDRGDYGGFEEQGYSGGAAGLSSGSRRIQVYL